MAGTLVHVISGFVEYRIENIIIGLSEQPVGWTGPDDEYPHHAFLSRTIFCPWSHGLRQNGGVISEPGPRDGIKCFRDSTGNLFEMYCRSSRTPPISRAGQSKAAVIASTLPL
jgi:hypothetical protein